MVKVAIVEKNASKINYDRYFDFEFDRYALTTSTSKRVLKADVDIDINIDEYDFIILVGADSCKHIGKITSVIKYQGYLVNEKFLPLTSPGMLAFKPEGKGAFDKAVQDITNYVKGIVSNLIGITIIAIENELEALNYIEKIDSPIIALDSETTTLYPRDGYVLGISISYKEDEGVYISSDVISERLSEALQRLYNRTIVIFHNAKFDMAMFKYHFNWVFKRWEDTMLLHYCLNEQPGTHDLKSLSIKYTDLGDYDRKLQEFKASYCRQYKIKVSDFTYDLIPFDILASYAAIDTIATFRLFILFFDKVIQSQKLNQVYQMLKDGTIFLLEIQENGVPFDKDRLVEAQRILTNRIEQIETNIYKFEEIHEFEKLTGKLFNPNSVVHLRQLFFDILKLPLPDKRTDTGAISTDAEVLEGLSKLHKLPKLILDIKKLKKIKSTYIDKIIPNLDRDGRLRTNYNLAHTTSGRLSSSGKLNMQQLPRDDKTVKKCIKAREGYKIVSQDLQTAEMYVVAVLSGDKVLQNIFIKGEDYHSIMAILKFNLPYTWQEVKEHHKDIRQEAKTVSFEILYKLNLREPALKSFKTLKRWLIARIEEIEAQGCIYQFFGRKRRLPNVFSKDQGTRAHEIRSGINSLVQGPASDVNLLAGIEMQKAIKEKGSKALIFGLVHDSILAEVPDEELDWYNKTLKKITQKDRGLSIKNCPIGIDVEIGEDYSFT